jgi:Uma2 family endonuclease
MATATRSQRREPATFEGFYPFRLTVRQFEKLIGAGVFPEGARVELLAGMLANKMTKYPPHDFAVNELGTILRKLLSSRWLTREEKAVVLNRFWRPEPDIAVMRGPSDLYRKRTPAAKDLVLLIEVSESSYATDRGIKWRGYAAAAVPCYWIVDLSKKVVEVYSSPAGRGEAARYRAAATYGPAAEVPVVIEGRDLGRVAVREVLI